MLGMVKSGKYILKQKVTGPSMSDSVATVDRRKRVAPSRPVSKPLTSKSMFGVDLDELMRREPTSAVVPTVVTKICDHILCHGLEQEGIFRISGSVRVMEKIRLLFDRTGEADLHEDNDIMAVASTLKLFLRELPKPVIPQTLTTQFLELEREHGEKESTVEFLAAVKPLLSQLPPHHYSLLHYLMDFLVKVSCFESSNKMNANSLAIVFGPNIFRCGAGIAGLQDQATTNKIIHKLITKYDDIFTSPNLRRRIIKVEETESPRTPPPRPPPPKLVMSSPILSVKQSVVKDSDKPFTCVLTTKDDLSRLTQPHMSSPRASEEDLGCASPIVLDSYSENGQSRIESPAPILPDSEMVVETIQKVIMERVFGDGSDDEPDSSTVRSLSQDQLNRGDITPSSSSNKSSAQSSPRTPNLPRSVKPMRPNKPLVSVSQPSSSNGHTSEHISPSTARVEHRGVTDLIKQFQLNDHNEQRRDKQQPNTYNTPVHTKRVTDSLAKTEKCDDDNAVPSLDLSSLHKQLRCQEPKPSHPGMTNGKSLRVIVSDLDDEKNTKEASLSPRAYESPFDYSVPLNTDVPPSPPSNQEEYFDYIINGSGNSIKSINKKIHALKRKIKIFEENYQKQHGSKPSIQAKRSNENIKKCVEELQKCKQELKRLKEDAVNHNGPNPVSNVGGYKESTNLSAVLNELFSKLSEKRTEACRPDDITLMSPNQIQDEKLSVQKVLLEFESAYGRPSTKDQKEAMRPLYDRYRLIKRTLSKSNSLNNDCDLPTVPEDKTIDLKPDTAFRPVESTKIGQADNFLVTHNLDLVKDGVLSNPQLQSVENELPSNSPLHNLTMTELQIELDSVNQEKKELRKILRQYEEEFYREHGRKVQKEDRIPLSDEYMEYKQIKARLKLLEVLVAKR